MSTGAESAVPALSTSALSKLLPRRGELLFSEPVRSEHADVVTVSRVRGGRATPIGIYVIRADRTEWMPSVDGNLAMVMGLTTGLIAATLGCVAVVRRPPWPDLRGTVADLRRGH
ncbi:MAG: hypothetical protein QM658_07640 [Gordonia sp. (in: high G+C Gram-positive bacteria)]